MIIAPKLSKHPDDYNKHLNYLKSDNKYRKFEKLKFIFVDC